MLASACSPPSPSPYTSMPPTFRVERDPLGEVRVPARAYYGGQTARAVQQLPDQRPDRAAAAHHRDHPDQEGRGGSQSRSSAAAAGTGAARSSGRRRRSSTGRLRDQFVVDVYQAGAGTSHNMNANEVLANRAGELLGDRLGSYARVHPNDHVNMGQSTNDVFPTATRLAILFVLRDLLQPREALAGRSTKKSGSSRACSRPGARTCRTPCRSRSARNSAATPPTSRTRPTELERTAAQLYELNLGATAVGTGLNAGDDYTRKAVAQPRPLHATAAAAGRQPLPRHPEHGRRACLLGSAAPPGGGGRRRSRPTCGCSAWGRAPASPRSSCPRCSRARRSCRARSTRRCPRWSTRCAARCSAATRRSSPPADAGQLELNVMMPVIAWNALHATRILARRCACFDTECVARHQGRRRTRPGAARSQHRRRHRAQPAYRIRSRPRRSRRLSVADRPSDS